MLRCACNKYFFSLQNTSKQKLTQDELEYYAAHLSDISIDGLENDEDDLDDDFFTQDLENELPLLSNEEISSKTIPENSVDFRIEDLPIFFENDHLETIETEETDNYVRENEHVFSDLTGSSHYNSDIPQTSLVRNKQNTKKKEPFVALKNMTWQKGNVNIPEDSIKFQGSTDLPEEIMSLSTPLSFFNYFFTRDLVESIAEESNLYSLQKNIEKPAYLTVEDIKQYIGVCLYMSIVHLPSIRHYWSKSIGYEKIKETMSLKKFEKIRQFIHFNNNETFRKDMPDYDRLHKIRPVIEALRKQYKKVPFEQYLSVDEQFLLL